MADGPIVRTTPSVPRAGAYIRVFGERVFLSHPVPRTGSLTIGRAEDCDIVVNEHSVSRVHATLHFADGVAIEDAGSSYGTRVGTVQLRAGQRCPLLPGQVAELGSVLVTIDAVAVAAPPPRRVWEHSHFEARIEEQCAARGARFAVARVVFPPGSEPVAVEAALAQLLGEADALASYAPGQYELLLVGRDADALRAWATTTAAVLRVIAEPRLAVTRFPEDGRNVAALQAHLSAALATPADAGAPLVVLDDAMVMLHRLIDRVASGEISVLLTGETGAGKEVLAERIHVRSPRRDQPFLRLNCAAVVEPLMESELFGHEKGAFTGAARAKPGLLETAAGGTVFLDEIGELPLALQAKLLRVLDERQVWPVGSLRARPIDVRFVAATNRDLQDEILRGRFRQDLYFRLSGVTLAVPPLRERPREILALAEAFAVRAATAMGQPPRRLGGDARSALASHVWPGNVRELKNVIERAVLLAQGDEIAAADLGLDRMRVIVAAAEPQPRGEGALHEQIDALERRRILDALESCGGNQSEAARHLGMSRGTLIARLDRYGVPRPRKPTL
jgi:DNA-binding NtrC family response regulator